MNKKEIKKQIVESLLEGKELVSSLMEMIEKDKELSDYFHEMKSLLSHKDDQSYDPGEDYFENAWEQIEGKINTTSTIIPLVKQKWVRAVAAIFLLGFSFYIGTLQKNQIQIEKNPVVTVKNTQLKNLFRKYNVTLTSFVNMDEYESHDLLKAIIKSSENLLDDTRSLKDTYRSNDDVYQVLTELERILFAITHLKNQSLSKVRVMQYKMQSEINIDEEIKTQI